MPAGAALLLHACLVPACRTCRQSVEAQHAASLTPCRAALHVYSVIALAADCAVEFLKQPIPIFNVCVFAAGACSLAFRLNGTPQGTRTIVSQICKMGRTS